MRFADSAGHTNYEIPVSNGLLTPYHVKRMRDAIWLELLLEDMVTDGEGDDGIVWGGKPVLDCELGKRLGKSEKTIARYRKALTGHYIQATRTMYGHSYRVLRSKKWAMIRGLRLDKSVQSQLRDKTHVAERSDTAGRSNKTSSGQLQEEQQPMATPQSHRVWAALGLDAPAGPKDFRALVESSYDVNHGRPLASVIGTCADAWQAAGGKVPGPFFRALAHLRAQDKRLSGPALEASSEAHLNTLADIIPRDR
jgi:hypothetical protein